MSQPNSSSSAQESPVNALRAVYADKQIGECFEFGRYPQGANGEIEPITWRVLQRNVNCLLVIAKQGLDCKPYNELVFFARLFGALCVWADCTLRRWLNSEFYGKAFNERERKCILKTNIVNNTGLNTDDSIFMLSVDEAKSLFANDRMRRANPTVYANEKGVFTNNHSCCYWWLRSRGLSDSRAACVRADVGVSDYGGSVCSGLIAVRPAFKIAL